MKVFSFMMVEALQGDIDTYPGKLSLIPGLKAPRCLIAVGGDSCHRTSGGHALHDF